MADKGPGAMLQKIVDDMPERTGKTFPAWVKIAKKDGPDKQMACVKWLKQTHSLLHNQALVVAAEAVGNSMLESYSDEGALIITREHDEVDPKLAAERTRRAVVDGVLATVGGKTLPVRAETVCIHSDTPNSEDIAKAVSAALSQLRAA